LLAVLGQGQISHSSVLAGETPSRLTVAGKIDSRKCFVQPAQLNSKVKHPAITSMSL
jgi:hypothetical protein